MKNIKTILILLAFFGGMSQAVMAGDSDTLRFKVNGNCEMCKERIEEALDVRGIKSADWNVETKMITVVYDRKKINEEKIHRLIAAAGYETEKQAADEEAYRKLPGCCQYTREKKEAP